MPDIDKNTNVVFIIGFVSIILCTLISWGIIFTIQYYTIGTFVERGYIQKNDNGIIVWTADENKQAYRIYLNNRSIYEPKTFKEFNEDMAR